MSRAISRTVRETSWSVQHSTGGLRGANLDKRQEGSQSPASKSNYANSYSSSYKSPGSDAGRFERGYRSKTKEGVSFSNDVGSERYQNSSREFTNENSYGSPHTSPRSRSEANENRYRFGITDGFSSKAGDTQDRRESPFGGFEESNAHISPYGSHESGGERYETSYRSGARQTFANSGTGKTSSITMKCPFGYLGCRAVDRKLQCNRIRSEAFELVPASRGRALLRAPNGKFIRIDDNADTWADGDKREGEEFVLSMRADSTLTIRCGSDRYLRWQYSGAITADALDQDESTMFNYSLNG